VSVLKTYEVAVGYIQNGKFGMALPLLQDCVGQDPRFGEAWLELHNIAAQAGNFPEALACLEKWCNCPVTPNSLDAVPRVRAQMEDYRNKINPKEKK